MLARLYNSFASSTQMLITKSIQQLKKTDPLNLIRNQKSICSKLNRLIRSSLIFNEENSHLQVTLNKAIIDQIYFPIKKALEDKKFQDQHVEIYQKFFQKLRSTLKDEIIFKTKTFKERQFQLHYERNTTTILQQFRSQNKLPPSSQLGESLHYAYQGWFVRPKQDEEFFLANVQMFDPHSSDSHIARLICSLLNSRKAAVFLGLNHYYQIEGVKMSNTFFQNIRQRVETVRKNLIFPARQQSEVFDIFCLKVQKNFGQNMIYDEDSKNQKQTVLIKIYANTENVGKAYFVMDLNQKKTTYKFYQDPKIDVLQEKYYNNMQQKLKEKKSTISPIINSKPMNYVPENTVIGATQEHKEKVVVDPLMYGKLPEKLYPQHSILIMTTGGEDLFKIILKYLQKDKDYRFYEIFKEFSKLNKNRRIFYMTHRTSTQALIKKAQDIDPDKKHIILLKIKPQLTLLRQSLIGRAYKKLKDRYQNYFQKQLVVKRKRLESKTNQFEHFFCFENELQTMFSFSLLEYSNIRTNFANHGKLNGAQFMTKEELLSLKD